MLSIAPHVGIAATQPDWAGTWGIWGGHTYDTTSYPHIHGSIVAQGWSDVEPIEDGYDWTKVDRCKTAVANGQKCAIMVYVDATPAWLHNDYGVPSVATTKGGVYPYYLDTTFQAHAVDMWNDLKTYVDSYSAADEAGVIFFQVPLGKSGDKGAYNGVPLDSQYNISDAQWTQYQKDMIDNAYSASGFGTTFKPLLFNLTDGATPWAVANHAAIMLKGRNIAQMHQMNQEGDQDITWNECKKTGRVCRGEFDGAVKNLAGWYTVNKQSAYYWGGLWALHNGLDIWNQRTQSWDLAASVTDPGFAIFNKYAGYDDPATTKYAWIYLKDGLDQEDTVRFPVATHGAVGSAARYASIVSAFSADGAANDDVTNQDINPMGYVNFLTGLNDVGKNLWPDDYSRFATRISGGDGVWRKDFSTLEYQGRFARKCTQGNYISFDLEDDLFGPNGKNVNPREPVAISIFYYDGGGTTWQLRGDLASGANKKIWQKKNGNTGTWKTKTKQLKASTGYGYFGNRGPGGADLRIWCKTGTSYFHGLEVKFYARPN